jgi:MerR family transcriptional regulator, light-induced transcriptional regulator
MAFFRLSEHHESIATMIYEFDRSTHPERSKSREKYLQDTKYTLRFLALSVDLKEPMLFENYMQWFGKLSQYLHFNLDSLETHFNATEQILSQVLTPEEFNPALMIYRRGVQAFIHEFKTKVTHDLNVSAFLEALLKMDIESANRIVQDALEKGATIQHIYLNIIQPAMYTVGDLWQQRKITVAKEHYITAAVQNIIGRLYPVMFKNKEAKPYSMTSVCAGQEMHEIGMRMTTDFFEMSGWDTTYLGSNLPVSSIIEHLNQQKTDVLAISATTMSHLSEVKSLISIIKNDPNLCDIKVLVGGKVFNETTDLWQKIGADCFANNAEQAVLMGTLMVGENNG